MPATGALRHIPAARCRGSPGKAKGPAPVLPLGGKMSDLWRGGVLPVGFFLGTPETDLLCIHMHPPRQGLARSRKGPSLVFCSTGPVVARLGVAPKEPLRGRCNDRLGLSLGQRRCREQCLLSRTAENWARPGGGKGSEDPCQRAVGRSSLSNHPSRVCSVPESPFQT